MNADSTYSYEVNGKVVPGSDYGIYHVQNVVSIFSASLQPAISFVSVLPPVVDTSTVVLIPGPGIIL